MNSLFMQIKTTINELRDKVSDTWAHDHVKIVLKELDSLC